MNRTKKIAFAALMAALANIMSIPPFAVPIVFGWFESSIHFFQLAIFVCGILAGPWAGLLAGAVGGIYMSVSKIPFIAGGIAILGGSVGLFSKRFRPLFASLLAWGIQTPYVIVTDYVWFTLFMGKPSIGAWTIVAGIMVNLTLQAVVCAVLAEAVTHYIKRSGIGL